MGYSFPEIYKCYLRVMNGTDKDTVNLYGESGESYSYKRGFLSFPRDIEIIEDRIKWIYDSFKIDSNYIEKHKIPHIMPIESHRFLVMDRSMSYPVLSMYEDDAILYSQSLNIFFT